MKARITVTLKTGVLDPQGKAIMSALTALGFDGISDIRQGKVFDIEIEEADPATATGRLESMCEKLLANTVIEDFRVDLA